MSQQQEVITVEQQQAVAAVSPINQPMQLLEMAVGQNADVEKLERLMDLQERWNKDQERKAFFAALSGFQSELPVIKKLKTASFPTRNGGQMTYNFASIDDISEQIKPLLSLYGLSYRFEQEMNQQAIRVTCIVTHKDGHSESCSMVGAPDTSGNKNAIQQIASTVTYLKRYTLTGGLGIATADADIDGRLPQSSAATYKEESQPVLIEHYPQEQFDKTFPIWEQSVLNKKKTPAEILVFLNKKSITLSQQQEQQIMNIGKE